MNRFLKMTSLAALCALLAVPAGAGAARGDFDLSASGLNTSGYAQQLGAPKSYGSEKLSLKMPRENAVQDGVNPITAKPSPANTAQRSSPSTPTLPLCRTGAWPPPISSMKCRFRRTAPPANWRCSWAIIPTAPGRFVPRACRCAPCGRCGAAYSASTAIRKAATKTT